MVGDTSVIWERWMGMKNACLFLSEEALLKFENDAGVEFLHRVKNMSRAMGDVIDHNMHPSMLLEYVGWDAMLPALAALHCIDEHVQQFCENLLKRHQHALS